METSMSCRNPLSCMALTKTMRSLKMDRSSTRSGLSPLLESRS